MELSEAKQLLLEQLLNDTTLSGLLEECARLLGAPLRFTFNSSPDGFILSEGYPYAEVVQTQLIISQMTLFTDESFHKYMDRFETDHGLSPFLLVPEASQLARRLVCVASVGGRRMGLLSLPEYQLPLEMVNLPLMALCAQCLGMRIQQLAQEGFHSSIRQGMYMLLYSPGTSYNDISGIVGASALPRHGHYHLLLLRACASADESRLSLLGGQIAQLFSTRWFSCVQEEAAVLFEDLPDSNDSRNLIDRLLTVENASGCLSPVFHDLMDAAIWRRRINKLPAYQHAGPGTLILFKDWLDWGLFSETTLSAEQLTALIPEEILAMRNWDQVHGTAFIPTLAAFIRHYGIRKQTAVALNTHVNTINYRLRKMEELFGMDFHALETPYRSFFAIRLMEYLDAMK